VDVLLYDDRLTPEQRLLANEVFHAYDSDASGSLDQSEFIRLVLNLDGHITRDAAAKTFRLAGVKGDQPMELWHFFKWVQTVFADSVRGVIEDKEGFVEQMEMLVSCNARDDKAQKAIKNRMGLIVERKQYKCNLSPVRKGWADKLFETISSQGGTVVAMSEFLRVLQTQACCASDAVQQFHCYCAGW